MTMIAIWEHNSTIYALADQMLSKSAWGHHKVVRLQGTHDWEPCSLISAGSGRSVTICAMWHEFVQTCDPKKIEPQWFAAHPEEDFDASVSFIRIPKESEALLIYHLDIERGIVSWRTRRIPSSAIFAMGTISPVHDGAPHDVMWTGGADFIADRIEHTTISNKTSRWWTLLKCENYRTEEPIWTMRNVDFHRSIFPQDARGEWHDGVVDIPGVWEVERRIINSK